MEQELIFNIVEKAKKGDSEAFADLYNASYKMVYLTCLGHMKNPEEAEDAAQETFITIYNKLGTLENNNTFFGWAKTVAVRECLQKLRKTRNNISFDDAVESGMNIEGDDNLEDLPDTVIMEEAKRNVILNILKSELKEVQYQTIFMYYYDNLPVEKIAELMNCPEGTVKTRLKAARVKIKSGIEDYEKKTGDKLCAAGMFPALASLFSADLGSRQVKIPPCDVVKSPRLAKGSAKKKGVKMSKGSRAVSKGVLASKSTLAKGTTGLATKIIAGVAAVAVVGSAVAGTAIYVNRPTYNVGDTVYFGNYEGQELSWVITDEEDGYYWLLSTEVLVEMPYYIDYDGPVYYELGDEQYPDGVVPYVFEDSAIFEWMNGEFEETAFNEHELDQIATDDYVHKDYEFFLMDGYGNYSSYLNVGNSRVWASDGAVYEGTQIGPHEHSHMYDGRLYEDYNSGFTCGVRPAMIVKFDWFNDYTLTEAERNGSVVERENLELAEDEFNGYVLGDWITFGEYNGEALNWIIVDEDGDGNYLLTAVESVANMPYYYAPETHLAVNPMAGGYPISEDCVAFYWEQSDVREWLNNEFYSSAFNREETSRINPTINDGVEDFVFVLNCTGDEEIRYIMGSSFVTDQANRWTRDGVIIRNIDDTPDSDAWQFFMDQNNHYCIYLECYNNRPNHYVVPSIWVNLEDSGVSVVRESSNRFDYAPETVEEDEYTYESVDLSVITQGDTEVLVDVDMGSWEDLPELPPLETLTPTTNMASATLYIDCGNQDGISLNIDGTMYYSVPDLYSQMQSDYYSCRSASDFTYLFDSPMSFVLNGQTLTYTSIDARVIPSGDGVRIETDGFVD